MIIVSTTPPVVEEELGPPVVDGPGRQVATLAYTWRGWTGQEWNLVDPGGKVVKVRGATGFGFAPVSHWYSDAPGIPGSDWGGFHDDRGALFLPLEVRGADSLDFLAVHRAFLKTLDPGRTGVIRVTTPDGRYRWAECRYSEGLDSPVELDPVASCGVRYGITWDRADPYWLGETVLAQFVDESAAPFFATTGGVFNIAPSNVLETGTVANPGDVESHALWTITGPAATFEVGVGDAVLAMSQALAAGQKIVANMDPRVLTVASGTGADRLADATDVAFEPIPPGEEVPLTMVATGTGPGFGISLEFVARYRSAW